MLLQAPSAGLGSGELGGDDLPHALPGPGRLLAELGQGFPRRPLEAPLAFRFCWRTHPFYAEVTAAAGAAGALAAPRLSLTGDLGPLPFTAESHGARADLIALTRMNARMASVGGLPCRLAIGRHMQLLLRMSQELSLPLGAAAILALTIRTLVAAGPLLDLVGEIRRVKADGAVAPAIAAAAG